MLGTTPYPPAAFFFDVMIGIPMSPLSSDAAFQEVSGIGPELETEDIPEGGENRFIYQLPKQVKNAKLVLKRGLAPRTSLLVQWCIDVLEGGLSTEISPQPIAVRLLGESSSIGMAWMFARAYPVHWEVDAFNAAKSDIAIETISFSYSYAMRLV